MKTFLASVSLLACISIILIIAAEHFGLALPAWLTVQSVFCTTCAMGVIAVGLTDYRPRRSLTTGETAPAAVRKAARKAAVASRANAAGEIFASTMGLSQTNGSAGPF